MSRETKNVFQISNILKQGQYFFSTTPWIISFGFKVRLGNITGQLSLSCFAKKLRYRPFASIYHGKWSAVRIKISEHRGMSYFSLQHGERNYGFIPTMITSMFSIRLFYFEFILTIHYHQLMIVTCMPLFAVVISLGTADVIIIS